MEVVFFSGVFKFVEVLESVDIDGIYFFKYMFFEFV